MPRYRSDSGASSGLAACSGSSTWARTRDLRINSPALYQLSYRGTSLRLYRRFFQVVHPILKICCIDSRTRFASVFVRPSIVGERSVSPGLVCRCDATANACPRCSIALADEHRDRISSLRWKMRNTSNFSTRRIFSSEFSIYRSKPLFPFPAKPFIAFD